MQTRIKTVGVVGAGAMGRGIAQIAAQAGCQVRLFDMQAAAVAAARDHVLSQWDRLQEKGKLDAAAVAACRERLQGVDSLEALAGCDVVIEAIVERLDAKRQLFAALEGVLGPTPSWRATPLPPRSPPSPPACSGRSAWRACISSTRCR